MLMLRVSHNSQPTTDIEAYLHIATMQIRSSIMVDTWRFCNHGPGGYIVEFAPGSTADVMGGCSSEAVQLD